MRVLFLALSECNKPLRELTNRLEHGVYYVHVDPFPIYFLWKVCLVHARFGHLSYSHIISWSFAHCAEVLTVSIYTATAFRISVFTYVVFGMFSRMLSLTVLFMEGLVSYMEGFGMFQHGIKNHVLDQDFVG